MSIASRHCLRLWNPAGGNRGALGQPRRQKCNRSDGRAVKPQRAVCMRMELLGRRGMTPAPDLARGHLPAGPMHGFGPDAGGLHQHPFRSGLNAMPQPPSTRRRHRSSPMMFDAHRLLPSDRTRFVLWWRRTLRSNFRCGEGVPKWTILSRPGRGCPRPRATPDYGPAHGSRRRLRTSRYTTSCKVDAFLHGCPARRQSVRCALPDGTELGRIRGFFPAPYGLTSTRRWLRLDIRATNKPSHTIPTQLTGALS